MIKNIVLSGGEMMGLCYIGVLKFFEENNIIPSIENILGISIGSLFAVMLSLNYNYEQMKKIALSINIDSLSDNNNRSLFSFIDTFGIDSGLNIEKFFKIIIKKKLGDENATFADLFNKSPKPLLLIGGSNINTDTLDIYSYNTTPNMPIWQALRISCGIPILFPPVRLNEHMLVDGGIINNYPINYFNNDLDNTLGIVLKRNDNCNILKINSVDQYLITIIKRMIYSFQNHLETHYINNTVSINANYCLFDFNFTNEAREDLINSGYEQFKEQYLIKFSKNNQTKINIKVETISNIEELDNIELDNMISDIQSIVSNKSETIDNFEQELQKI
jgi:NTE family protein